MNISEIYLIKIKKILSDLSKKNIIQIPDNLNNITVETPPEKFNADLSSNVSMIISKHNKQNPLEFGKIILDELSKDTNIENIEIVKPGFINFKFKKIFWNKFIQHVIQNYKDFGSNKDKKNIKFLVEFVSANPTGPLHVGHCRGAVLGDVISNLLKFNNYDVTKEYYVNDYGNQIVNFTNSVLFRIKEIINNKEFPKNNSELYPGEYIIDIANNIINQNKTIKFENLSEITEDLKIKSIDESLKLIKKNLHSLGVHHDNFKKETDLISKNEVDKVIQNLKKKNLIYTGKIKAPKNNDNSDWVEREQLLFKSTNYGDDKDRALQKSDKSWTYFANDVAYHNNKLERKYDKLVNILGADHAGYIKRISSSVEALSSEKDKLICKVSQLVKLIKDGKPFKMSKRKGSYITVEDLLKEVGKDATRFIMLNRSSDVELDFDFDQVKEKTKDNPLYYVQYAYARISSVFRNINRNIEDKIELENFHFTYTEDEIKILKKIAQWPLCIDIATKKLEPHRIPIYLYELSSQFHSYWNMGRDDETKRFIDKNKKISDDKIALLKATSFVIKNGMKILGVSTPEEM
tara:strand:+ start:144 stop:1874 length:1731 start_codon:yes stop_codon:yes gene_type:complete